LTKRLKRCIILCCANDFRDALIRKYSGLKRRRKSQQLTGEVMTKKKDEGKIAALKEKIQANKEKLAHKRRLQERNLIYVSQFGNLEVMATLAGHLVLRNKVGGSEITIRLRGSVFIVKTPRGTLQVDKMWFRITNDLEDSDESESPTT